MIFDKCPNCSNKGKVKKEYIWECPRCRCKQKRKVLQCLKCPCNISSKQEDGEIFQIFERPTWSEKTPFQCCKGSYRKHPTLDI